MEHVATVVRAAVDLLFPPVCLVCGEPGGRRPALCEACGRSIVRLAPPWCAVCGRPFWTLAGESVPPASPAAQVCGPCRSRRPGFTYARSAAAYEGTVREALHAFKFSGKTALAGPLGDLLLETCARGVPVAPDLVVPVPLHPARERERGFNQAALLARRVARGLGVPLDVRALRRVRATRAQTDLSGAERRANVRGAFAVRDRANLAGRHVLLVDDVLTTGATISACARALLDAGATTVGALTVARVT
jgi:ComF family protein